MTNEETYFLSLRGAKGQLGYECDTIKNQAYKQTYEAVKSDPKQLEKLDKGLISDIELETIAKEQAQKARKKALPTSPLGVASMLQECVRFIRIKPEVQGQKAPLYYYDPDKGIWVEDNEFLQDLISVIYPEVTEKQAFDILYKIARQSTLRKIQSNYTVIGDKLYNSETEEFKELTPDIIVTRKINTGYNPEAEEPTIKGWKPSKWLAELFDNDQELYNLAIQIIKASITGRTLKNIFWLYGEGGTGKGTFQQLLINLVGMDNVASLKMTEFDKSRFSTSILLGKTLVIGDDVQKDAVIKDTSNMFSLATGDIMTIEDKGKRPYSLRLNMTIVQSSNGLPRMNGDREAIDRRFKILPFTRVFKGKPNKAIKEYYINKKEVLEYFTRLALETPTEDITPEKSKEILRQYHEDNNPVIAFVSSFFTEELTSEFLPNSFVFHNWKGFTEYYGVKLHKSEMSLHREIKNNLPSWITTGQKTISAGRQLPSGFYPNEDRPPYAQIYFNGREKPEQRRKSRNERGYFNGKAKKRK